MDIREQLKIEWLTDLPVMKEEDAMFLYQVSVLSYSYFRTIQSALCHRRRIY
jgi:hypothetical protein